jgi:phosphoribosyl-AMP cyclohydrolase
VIWLSEIEESLNLDLDFGKIEKICNTLDEIDVIPVAVQDIETKEVLIIAYVNYEALDYTMKNQIAAFWSTSRNQLWIKGESSGNILRVEEIRINCEQNSLLYLVKPKDGACHTKDKSNRFRKTCYYRKINIPQKKLEFIS